MKNALMLVGTPDVLNIGDYIQAVASAQFFKQIDVYIEREKLRQYDETPVKMIMNGWYMHHPKSWPPSPLITPLFVAFHINSSVKDRMLTSESISYLRKHEPIGCRDIDTMNLLQKHGVKSYFSGCMTLTLGYKYKDTHIERKCYFVDPFYPSSGLSALLKAWITLFCNMKLVYRILRKKKLSFSLKSLLKTALFYNVYSKVFSDELLINAEYIKHESKVMSKLYPENKDLLKYAESLVEKYAKATLVVTSRIHCALPCIGLETPVIYVEDIYQGESSSCRLKGLKDLFTILECNEKGLVYNEKNKISFTNIPVNKDLYKEYANNLISKCLEFSTEK